MHICEFVCRRIHSRDHLVANNVCFGNHYWRKIWMVMKYSGNRGLMWQPSTCNNEPSQLLKTFLMNEIAHSRMLYSAHAMKIWMSDRTLIEWRPKGHSDAFDAACQLSSRSFGFRYLARSTLHQHQCWHSQQRWCCIKSIAFFSQSAEAVLSCTMNGTTYLL